MYEPDLYTNENFIRNVTFEENKLYRHKKDRYKKYQHVIKLQQAQRLSSKQQGATSLLGKKGGTGTARLQEYQEPIKPNVAGARPRVCSMFEEKRRSSIADDASGAQSVLPGPRNYIQRAVQVVAKEKASYTKTEEEKVKVIAEMQEITCATLRELGRRNFLREGGEKFSH